jgi:hypothetical protein
MLDVFSKHLRFLTGAVVRFIPGNRKSDGAKTLITRFLNRGHADDLVGNVNAEDVFSTTIFPCATVRRTLITILEGWSSLYEIVDELDPRVYRRDGWKAGLWMVGLLNMSIVAFGQDEPSPTLRSNAWHFMSFSGRYQLWNHVPSLRSNKLVENMHRTLTATLTGVCLCERVGQWWMVETHLRVEVIVVHCSSVHEYTYIVTRRFSL